MLILLINCVKFIIINQQRNLIDMFFYICEYTLHKILLFWNALEFWGYSRWLLGYMWSVCINFMSSTFCCRSGVMCLRNAGPIYKYEKDITIYFWYSCAYSLSNIRLDMYMPACIIATCKYACTVWQVIVLTHIL